jgi:YebC/PmpR family DNA-binding regulatory protein
MPKDNIERAIKRGMGELGGETMESVMYEGFAPGGSAVMVEAITDNRNRTAQLVKSIFQKAGANLGGPGSVAWMFDRRGVIRLAKSEDNTLDELELIEMGADDIINEETETIVITSPEKFIGLKNSLLMREQEILEADVIFWPKTPANFPEGPDGDKLSNFLSSLDDLEEVDKVATSAVL